MQAGCRLRLTLKSGASDALNIRVNGVLTFPVRFEI